MIAERRDAMRREMRQKEQDNVVKAGMGKIFGLDGGSDEDDGSSWSRSSSSARSDDDAVRPVRVQPKPRGFWNWEQGRPNVHTQFPPCLPSDPGERLHTPDLSHPDYSIDTRDLQSPDPFAGKPKAQPASPPRKDRPTVWRQWSLDRQQERPRTREVLWPHDGRPWHKPPKLRRRRFRPDSTEGDDEEVVSEHSVYKDEHIGFKSLDQGQWILAHKDAQRQNELQDEEAKRQQMMAARHADTKGQFVTAAAKSAVAEPEIFSLRMVRGDNRRREEHRAHRAARKARKAEMQHKRRTEEAVQRYEIERRQAIQMTMSLPNLGRPYAAWRRFVRLLRVQTQTAALDELRKKAHSIVSAPATEYAEAMKGVRRTVSETVSPVVKQSDLVTALQNDDNVELMLRPLSAGPPLPSLDGDRGSESDDLNEPYIFEDVVQSRLAQYDAFSAAVYHNGARLPVVSGAKPADKVRHGFADACRRQNMAPVPVMPAPYLFGPAEAGIVDLRDKMIGNKLAVAVFQGLAALSQDCRVRSINLAGNGLTEQAMHAFSPLLSARQVVKTLVKLDLSRNPLGVKGSQGLAAAIAGNPYLDLQISTTTSSCN
jgi:hypothetical protein